MSFCPGTDPDTLEISSQPDGCVLLSNNSMQPGWRSNYHGDYKDSNLKPICTQDLLSWAFQVARGMEYLSQRRVRIEKVIAKRHRKHMRQEVSSFLVFQLM